MAFSSCDLQPKRNGGGIMEWLVNIFLAGGFVVYGIYAVLLLAFFVFGIYEKFQNRGVRIYSGLALTIAVEGRFLSGVWPFGETAMISRYNLEGAGDFWLLAIIPISATLLALLTELIIYQATKMKQEKRPEFIRRTYGKFNYEFVFLFLFSPLFLIGVAAYAAACGLL